MDHSESKNGREYFSKNKDIQSLKKYIHDIRNSKPLSIDILHIC